MSLKVVRVPQLSDKLAQAQRKQRPWISHSRRWRHTVTVLHQAEISERLDPCQQLYDTVGEVC